MQKVLNWQVLDEWYKDCGQNWMQPNLNGENGLDRLIILYRKREESIVPAKFLKQGIAPVVHSQHSECLPTTGYSQNVYLSVL